MIVLKPKFNDWVKIFQDNKQLLYTEKLDKINKVDNFIPSTIEQTYHTRSIFKNDSTSISILNNKSIFAEFMMNNFPSFIPRCCYYNYSNKTYKSDMAKKMILKPNISDSGIGIKIINSFEHLQNSVISEYLDHTEYITGHFLTKNGVILHKTYFVAQNNQINFVKKGKITNYKIFEKLAIDDSIFNKIFEKLNFSGISCSDFIIKNNSIIIFEINPRIGGSLVHDNTIFNTFLTKIKINWYKNS